MRRLMMLIGFVLSVVGLSAQAPAPAVKPAPLTQVETMGLEILELRAQLVEATRMGDQCRAEIAPLRTASNKVAVTDSAQKLKAALESTRPGWVWDYKTRTFVPVPTAPVAKPQGQ